MKSSPSPSDRRAARFVLACTLVLGLGLAGLLAGCGAGDGTTAGPANPEARKLIEESKRQAYKEEKASAAGKKGGAADGARPGAR